MLGFERARQRMMINKVDAGVLVHAARGRNRLCVYGENIAEGFAREFFLPRKGERVRVEGEEIAHVAVQTARQNCARGGVDFLRAQKRGERVEIGVLVRKDGVHWFSGQATRARVAVRWGL